MQTVIEHRAPTIKQAISKAKKACTRYLAVNKIMTAMPTNKKKNDCAKDVVMRKI